MIVCFAVIFFSLAVCMAGQKMVLLITERNTAKDPVLSKVITILKKDGCYVKITNLKEITGRTTKKYGAVILINDVESGQGRPVKVFLDETEQKKIVLFNAVGKEYWKSADKKDNADKIAYNIIQKTYHVLKTVVK